ncbi:acetyltransferase [Spiroplasma taiwanense CT-1]|uniref:Acetyltransferase n=1 Tax=Spiroplasma taiwanense CT-1 TaxID=1276220 RepID=S5LYL2_9MOLU|nr:CatB-related O-acetyltransferase [Spiroplasma taiwanense]AGR40742.1 acetyltransferase [Spiroplasma taiwanense CT-1]
MEYTYFYSFKNEQGIIKFQNKNGLYHFPQINNDKLIIGKFCAIADEVKFIMNGANHRINSFSTYSFEIFNKFSINEKILTQSVSKGDTIIGNDVWFGYGSTIMPGVKIGNGAIIATKSVVVNDVEPYTIVGGNSTKLIRKRFDQETINKLEKLKWWDKEIGEINSLVNDLVNNLIK